MAKNRVQAILKRASAKPTKASVQVKKDGNDMISGGIHSHWRHWEHKDYTSEGGSHDHIFLIAGKLYRSEYDGEHMHGLQADGIITPQLQAHNHSIFIDGEYYAVMGGGAHAHAEGMDPDKDTQGDRVLPGGEHRHTVEVEGVTHQSIVSADLFATKIAKSLNIGIQSLVLNKARFLTFEVAAQKAEALDLDLKKVEERETAFVFTQRDMGKFKEFSLQTITIEDGVDLVIGVLVEGELPDSTSISLAPNATNSQVDTQAPVAPAAEIAAFDEVQAFQTLGYPMLSDGDIIMMASLKDDLAENVMALKAVSGALTQQITSFTDAWLEKAIEAEDQEMVNMLDRINTSLCLIDEGLAPFVNPAVEVEINKELEAEFAEIKDSGHLGQALDLIGQALAPLQDVFKDTSFHRFHLTTKSASLSIARILKEHLSIEKAMIPMAEMTREELKIAQEARAARWGIEIVDGSILTFPTGFPTDLNMYGDPVNLKFPIESKDHAASARNRFKEFANQLYQLDESKIVVHSRIVSRELELGLSVVLNETDPLDKMLASGLWEDTRVTIVTEKNAGAKTVFVPVLKGSNEERTVFGIVLEPDVTDIQLDTYDEEAVKNTAWQFMENMQNIGKQHTQIINDKVNILESYVAPVKMNIDTPAGAVKIKKGTWLMRVRIVDDVIWQDIKNGDLTGFSIGALASTTTLKESK